MEGCTDCERVVAEMRRLAERGWKSTGGVVVNLHKRHQESGVDACLTVVANMAEMWIGGEMEFWFRPSTLFRPKHFDEYLNAKRRKTSGAGTHRMRQFKITCQGCKRQWMREVVVPSTVRFTPQPWNRKTYDEGFLNSMRSVGEACSCEAIVLVEPIE